MKYVGAVTILIFSITTNALPKLSSKFNNLRHPDDDRPYIRVLDKNGRIQPQRAQNDLERMLAAQGPVRDQGDRNTCTIFTTTAVLETLLVERKGAPRDIDLSEEWLQYLISQHSGEEGSYSEVNFKMLREFGIAYESTLPYLPESWDEKTKGLAQQRCGRLKGWRKKSCYISHRDPSLMKKSEDDLLNPLSWFYDPAFSSARREALTNRDLFLGLNGADGRQLDAYIKKVSEIQRLLDEGVPLILDIDFYMGAWSWPDIEELGVPVNKQFWNEGFVSHPESGSMDEKIWNANQKNQDGHSVVIIGYDNNREVEYTLKMADGTDKKFVRRGVYYFKNSWGTADWAKDFAVKDKKLPGYGMIMQTYAHKHGEFSRLGMN